MAEAMRVTSVVSPEEEAEHLQRVAARQAHVQTPEVRAALRARADAIEARIDSAARVRAARSASKATSGKAKIVWLRAEAATVVNAVQGDSACRAGCAHCCYTAVTVDRAEAEMIGKEIGRRPKEPPADRIENAESIRARNAAREGNPTGAQLQRARWTGVPCTFLGPDNRCSIYPHRPIACRLHYAMDEDSLLCRLVPGKPIDGVPYLNARRSQMLYAEVMKWSDFADVRDWFPAEATRETERSRG